VRPRERVFDVDWEPDSLTEDERARLAAEYRLESLTNCSVCHR
jgi:mono/diheme cytochrome c family protein